MQPTVSSFLTPLALKTAGVVLILSLPIDLAFTLLFVPETVGADPTQWWLMATSQLAQRGLLPLVGIAFIAIGDWIEIVSTEDGGSRGNGWRIGVFSLSSLLGLIFLMIIPFQLLTTNTLQNQKLKTIDDTVAQRKAEVKSQNKDKIQQQITAIDAEIKSGRVQGQAANDLKNTRGNLELLLNDPKKLAQEVDNIVKQLDKEKQKAQAQVSNEVLQTGIRTSLTSLPLAIAYTTIGWMGLRRVLK